jgi:plastocyanin
MTMKLWSGLVGVGMLMMSFGCARETPLAPSEESPAMLSSAEPSVSATSVTTSVPVVTLQPNLTADPARVTVAVGGVVKFVNKSGRYAKVHSYNCTEFTMIALPDGGWRNTQYFRSAGRTCEFFVWENDWSRKLFEGQVVVQ